MITINFLSRFQVLKKRILNKSTFNPTARDVAPIIIDFIPEAHTLFTVVHGVEFERPAPRAAWRAGA